MIKFLFAAQVLSYLFAGLLCLILRRPERVLNVLSYLLAALAGFLGLVYSLSILLTGTPLELAITTHLPFGALHFKIDLLSAFFVGVISFLSIPASIFAVGYTREFQGKHSLARMGFFYHAFLLAMILVVTVTNAFYFLVFWELMSLASYFLVIVEHEKPEAARAGLIYFIMTHAGTALIAASFWLLIQFSGSFDFAGFSGRDAALPAVLKNVIFISAFIGFGTKAGMIPLHIWLPEAHPAAPSHVSALMSGVMIKTAIYALLRFIFDFLGGGFLWWGIVILLFGILSTLVGILYALMEHDLKRLLAFSSIENIGIILLGIGISLVLNAFHKPAFAAFALIAALYHGINHAAFKGGLFLAAGSVLAQTHTRNMEGLGGLIKKMPWTSACFLITALAISALPPLNGFISEWMIFVSLLGAFQCDGVVIRFFAPVLAALLGLAGALAATCFVKAFGITFLGKRRSDSGGEVHEVGTAMKVGMTIPAIGCFAFALLAPEIISVLGQISAALLGPEAQTGVIISRNFLIPPSGLTQLSPLFILVFVFFILTIPGCFLWARSRAYRIGTSWDCGVRRLSPRMQYSATGYSKPIRRIFSFLYQPSRKVEVEDEGHEILRQTERFESTVRPLFEELFYRPLSRLLLFISGEARKIQTGHIQLYLSYIFVTLILLLIFARVS